MIFIVHFQVRLAIILKINVQNALEVMIDSTRKSDFYSGILRNLKCFFSSRIEFLKFDPFFTKHSVNSTLCWQRYHKHLLYHNLMAFHFRRIVYKFQILFVFAFDLNSLLN